MDSNAPTPNFANRSGTFNQQRQCNGFSKLNGDRCKRYAIPGGTVCAFHGGNVSFTREKAQMRLLAMADSAFEYLHQVMADELEESETRLKAAFGILNRSGFSEKQIIAHEVKDATVDAQGMTHEQLAQEAQATATRIRAAAVAVQLAEEKRAQEEKDLEDTRLAQEMLDKSNAPSSERVQ